MQVVENIQWKNYQPEMPLHVNLDFARKPSLEKELICFIITYYANPCSAPESWLLYQAMIDVAIISDNYRGLVLLSRGITYHDRNHADYLHNLYLAGQVSSLPIVKYCLHAQMHFYDFNGREDLEFKNLLELASINPNKDVKEYITMLGAKFVSKQGILKPCGVYGEHNSMLTKHSLFEYTL